jgi:hypothetical protein
MESANTEDFESWTAEQLADYLKLKCDLADYYEVILKHDITGKVAPRLTEADLKEMGIDSIGDRKRLQLAVRELQKAARKVEREKVIWEGKEQMWYSCWDAAMNSCCGLCPVDPATYKLTGTHLTITQVEPCYVGPFRCCCGHEYSVDNVVRIVTSCVCVHAWRSFGSTLTSSPQLLILFLISRT